MWCVTVKRHCAWEPQRVRRGVCRSAQYLSGLALLSQGQPAGACLTADDILNSFPSFHFISVLNNAAQRSWRCKAERHINLIVHSYREYVVLNLTRCVNDWIKVHWFAFKNQLRGGLVQHTTQTNPAVEQNKNVKCSSGPWNQFGRRGGKHALPRTFSEIWFGSFSKFEYFCVYFFGDNEMYVRVLPCATVMTMPMMIFRAARVELFIAWVLCPASYRVFEYSTDTESSYFIYFRIVQNKRTLGSSFKLAVQQRFEISENYAKNVS